MPRATKADTSGREELASGRCEQILDAATRLFARHGYSDAVTQLLADELGVGKGTIYRYFPSKRELFLAAVDRVMTRLRESIDARTADVEDPLDRVRLAVEAYLGYFREHPEAVELIVQERASFRDRERPTYFEHRERDIRPWRDLYRSLIAGGRLRDMPVERISDVLSCAMYGSMFLHYLGGRSGSLSADARDIVDVVFHGILSEPERTARPPRPPRRK